MTLDATLSPSDRGLDRDEVDRLGLPLGPQSLTWKLFGDARGLLLAQRAGVLQNMHPVISRALIEHSDFFENPLDRLIRSGTPILGVVYDDPAGGTAERVRDYHRGIRSDPDAAERYAALDPDVYYWAHATFFEGQIAAQRMFGTPLTDEQQEQLYRESITWYARYGLSLRPVPRDYAAFRRYWDWMFATQLRPTPVGRFGVRTLHHLPPPNGLLPAAVRGPVWVGVRPVAARALPWLARVTLPREAREILGVTLSPADRVAFAALVTAVRTGWPATPPALRRMPTARSGDRRVARDAGA